MNLATVKMMAGERNPREDLARGRNTGLKKGAVLGTNIVAVRTDGKLVLISFVLKIVFDFFGLFGYAALPTVERLD